MSKMHLPNVTRTLRQWDQFTAFLIYNRTDKPMLNAFGSKHLKTDNIPCCYYCSNSFLKRSASVKDIVKKPDPYGSVFLKAVYKKIIFGLCKLLYDLKIF